MNTVNRMLSAREAGEVTNLGERFIRRLIQERRIPFHKLGRNVRISERDLADWLAKHRRESARH